MLVISSHRVAGTAGTIVVALASITGATGQAARAVTVHGVVAGVRFTPGDGSRRSEVTTAYFANTRVCFDANDDGVCSSSEGGTTTDARGAFVLTGALHPLVADIPHTEASSVAPGVDRLVFRAAPDAVTPDALLAITPLSTEAIRMMEDDDTTYAVARARLAARLGVAEADVAVDAAQIADPRVRSIVTQESVVLSRRFGLAAKMVERRDVPGMTMKAAQQAAMNLEDIPRYDHIFIITIENKPTSSIRHSPLAPHINAYLDAGNEFTSYYATGNPSEPNRLAAVAADDFGVTDDNAWSCVREGDTANLPEDPLPEGMMPCVHATNHNLKHRANLFTAMTKAGLSWRMYSESMNPGRDVRLNGVADPTLIATDHVYPADSPVAAIGNPKLRLPFPASLYMTKHNGTVNFQDLRSSPDFSKNNRTLGGGQWDEAIRQSPNTPAGWSVDQFGSDLASGDVGQLNYLEPDQCDDMHSIRVQGTVDSTGEAAIASDCNGPAGIYRGDLYVDYLVRKIEASSLWKNSAKRVAIVLMVDEASATTGANSCCGWNPSAGRQIAGSSLGVLYKDRDGNAQIESIANYNMGNKGHGASVFGVLTNQPNAPKHIADSDAYSHISFVRTLQDMFQLADPGDDWSYMNRSKYTERFIKTFGALLPEYANSADPHFDAVRPMNHVYVIPAGYVQKNGFPEPQVGPDKNQINAWALK